MMHRTIPSPVGQLLLPASEDGLTGIWFEQHRHGPADIGTPVDGRGTPIPGTVPGSPSNVERTLDLAAAQLAEYFEGRMKSFDIPLAPRGTGFQLAVWDCLRSIPYGATMSYLELASRIGNPQAVRAVGGANGRNPLSIV